MPKSNINVLKALQHKGFNLKNFKKFLEVTPDQEFIASHSSKCAIAKFALSLDVFIDIAVFGSIIQDEISGSQSFLPKWAKKYLILYT